MDGYHTEDGRNFKPPVRYTHRVADSPWGPPNPRAGLGRSVSGEVRPHFPWDWAEIRLARTGLIETMTPAGGRSSEPPSPRAPMCGIAGIIDFRGRLIPEERLQQLNRQMGHRGPDDAGIWRFHSAGFTVGLAHTRLAVIDPSSDGHQPMTDATGRYAVSYNGELYNYQQLRRELSCRTGSDTEVILQACAAWGPEALERLDAMWAMAFVDTVERAGHLSRDPFGIKPLYYAVHDDRLLFASELSTLRLIPGLPTEIDPDALAFYLMLGYIPHPLTIYSSVRKLPPGHRLRFGAKGPEEPERYYHLGPSSDPPPAYPDAVAELRRRVEAAVATQRIADVPLGAFLSGGLDSAVVVACLAQAGTGPVKTFTIGYPEHPRYDETRYARMVAERFETEDCRIDVGFGDVLDVVEPMIRHLGEPLADSSLLPTALVSRHTRQKVTVALSGDGGDELFGGYWRYLGHQYLDRYHQIPQVVRRMFIEPLVRRVPSARSTRMYDRLRQVRKLLAGDGLSPIDRHLAWARHMDQPLAEELLGTERAERTVRAMRTRRLPRPGDPPT